MVRCFWQQGIGEVEKATPGNKGGDGILGRVLHVVNGEHYAGAERVQDLLGSALPGFGYEAAIACVKPGRFSAARKNKQVPLFECAMRRRYDVRPVRTLVRLIQEEGYDLLHAHTPRSLMVASAASVVARVPLVYHVHSPAIADTASRKRNWGNAILERLSLVSASHLVTVSSSLRERYLGLGLSPGRVTVVPNGVPCAERLPLRDRAEDEPIVFGVTALFRPRKGLEILLQSMARLLADGRKLRLRAIGQFETHEYEQEIASMASGLGVGDAIDWLGFRGNIEKELAQIDCLVLPSLFGEGLPMVILEAMACGRPVVATKVEGTPEAIRHGENGLLAEPNDPASLAAVMKQVIDGSCDLSSLAERAAEDQRSKFSLCSMTRGIAEVYDRVLGISAQDSLRDCRDMPCVQSCSRPPALSETPFPSLADDEITPSPQGGRAANQYELPLG